MALKSALLSPFSLHGLNLANRVVMSPMTRSRSGPEGIPGEIVAQYYQQRSSVGLIVTEGVSISQQAAGWMHVPGIYNDLQEAAWKQVVQRVHENGGKIFIQLWHTGRASHSSFHGGQLPVAPSAIKISTGLIHAPAGKVPYDDAPRALETEEVAEVVQDYRRAAERALRVGFDGVNIHGANGYLIDQFLQSKTNHREDKYGGSIENRYRFLQEIVEAVGQVYPYNRIAVRLGPNGVYNDMGSPDFREQFTYVIQQLNKYGLAYLDLCDGLGFGFHQQGEQFTIAEARSLYTGILSANIGYDRQKAIEVIEAGHADLVSIGRPLISNPDLISRWQNDYPEAPPAPFTVYYTYDAVGYTDYPNYSPQ